MDPKKFQAFHTIQSALNAVPDDLGGHRIVIRPDTYDEANLFPAYPGAPGAYNVLEGDWDGGLGSGATGWVVLDSGAPLCVVRTNPQAPTGNPTLMILTDGNPEPSGLDLIPGPVHRSGELGVKPFPSDSRGGCGRRHQ